MVNIMNRTELISQAFGVSLAIVTACGCIAYERMVIAFPFWAVGMMVSMSYVPFWICALIFSKEPLPPIRDHWGALLIFVCSGITAPLWYAITKKQGVLVSSTYEIKYVVILGIFYAWFGEHKITPLAMLGVLLAVASVWCLSRTQ